MSSRGYRGLPLLPTPPRGQRGQGPPLRGGRGGPRLRGAGRGGPPERGGRGRGKRPHSESYGDGPSVSVFNYWSVPVKSTFLRYSNSSSTYVTNDVTPVAICFIK